MDAIATEWKLQAGPVAETEMQHVNNCSLQPIPASIHLVPPFLIRFAQPQALIKPSRRFSKPSALRRFTARPKVHLSNCSCSARYDGICVLSELSNSCSQCSLLEVASCDKVGREPTLSEPLGLWARWFKYVQIGPLEALRTIFGSKTEGQFRAL